MRKQEIRCSFRKSYPSYDMYGDLIYTYVNQEPIYIWLTTKDVIRFNNIDIEGLQYSYIGITRDRRVEKNDLIDDKKVIYKIEVNRFSYLFLQDFEGSDDSE